MGNYDCQREGKNCLTYPQDILSQTIPFDILILT